MAAPRPSLASLCLLQRCPSCGKGKLFEGFLKVKDRCTVCDADLAQYEQGDGPAFLAICVVGFLITGLAAWVELSYQPSFWVHAALWGPLTLIACVYFLRVFKALIVAVSWEKTV